MQEASMRWCMHFKVRTPCSHVRRAWEGLWQQSKPNIAFGREGGVKSNPTVALTLGRLCTWGCYPTQRCRCLLMEEGVRSNSTVASTSAGVSTQRDSWHGGARGESGVQPNGPIHFAIGGLISRDVQLQPNGAVGLGEKGLFNSTQKNNFFGLLSKLNICL